MTVLLAQGLPMHKFTKMFSKFLKRFMTYWQEKRLKGKALQRSWRR